LRGAKESRLYVYADESSEVLHILGVGTKETQKRDVNEAVKKASRMTKIGG